MKRLASRLAFAVIGSFLFTLASGWAAEDKMRWEKTLNEARREGRVVVVGPPPTGNREAIMKFQESFPDIRVEYTGMASAQFEPRISKERQLGQYLWDVIVSGISPTVYENLIPAGFFEPVKPALMLAEVVDDSKWLGGFDAGFLDKGKSNAYAFALNVSHNVYVNREVIPESSLQKMEGLLDSRWKGKIAFHDPRGGGPGLSIFTHLKGLMGDEAMKRLIVEQEAVVTRDGRQLAEWLVRGRYPIAIGVSHSEVARFQKEGIGLEVKRLHLPVERVAPGWGGVLVLNRAPHPNAAKTFVNWLLSQRGQQAWAELGKTNSRRLDVPPGDPEEALDPNRLKNYVNLQAEEYSHLRAEAISLAKSLLK